MTHLEARAHAASLSSPQFWDCCTTHVRLLYQGLQGRQNGGAAAEPPSEPAQGAVADPKLILDWKGDPMVINPNDNMPFF